VVSYYQKGALVALALDLAIRAQTRGKRSLDDVMRLLWRHCKDAGADYRGVAEDGIVAAAEEATGLNLGVLIAEWTEGTRDPDFAALLAPFGIDCARRPAVDAAHFAMLGVKTAADGKDCRFAHVFDGSPAQKAGLSANDVLIALGGLRVTPDNLDKLLARYSVGDTVEVQAFRRDELMRFEIKLATEAPSRYTLKVEPKSTAGARRLRAGWLGERQK
jgi:predicted metalloprotease with PDZ domain